MTLPHLNWGEIGAWAGAGLCIVSAIGYAVAHDYRRALYYAFAKDWRHALYFLFAGCITIVVIYK